LPDGDYGGIGLIRKGSKLVLNTKKKLSITIRNLLNIYISATNISTIHAISLYLDILESVYLLMV
jgi:hypothetical protein